MFTQTALRKFSAALTLAAMIVLATSARGQAPESPPSTVDSELVQVRAENSAIREELRRLEEQQKTVLQKMEELQRRLDGGTATHVSIAGKPILSPTTADASLPAANAALNYPPAVTNPANTSVKPASFSAPQTNDERYQDGIVIWETSDEAKVPFLLNFNVNTQLRYLNTLDSNETFTDHLVLTTMFIRATISR